MNFVVAKCPKCEEIILVKASSVFVNCPQCQKKINSETAIELMDTWLSEPENITKAIAICLDIEQEDGAELPLLMLEKLASNFPLNEQIQYMYVKMSDFEPSVVKQYLLNFKDIKKKVPWAEPFLIDALTVYNMQHAQMFEDYIGNRLPSSRGRHYIEILRDMKERYAEGTTGRKGLGFLYTFYVIGGVANIAMFFFFLFTDLHVIWYVLFALSLTSIELFILRIHNRAFGNRLEISSAERGFMAAFMSTIVLVIGGVFLGIFITIG